MSEPAISTEELLAEIEDLRARLAESEQIIEAIRSGAVDGIVVSGSQGDQVFTLQGADHTYKTLIEQMGQGAAIVNQQGHILYANQALCRLLRTDVSVLVGSPIYDHVEQGHRPALDAAFQTNLEDAATVESVLGAAVAANVPVQMNLVRVQVEDVDLFCIVFADLTDQVRRAELLEEAVAERTRDLACANQDIRESERRFRAIVEQAAVGVAQIETPTGRFVSVNHKYCEIVGLEPDEMSATTFMAITHPDDLQEDLDNMEKLKSGDIRDFTMEKRYFRKDGVIVWVKLSVSPMWDVGEEPSYHIAVVQDITKQKRADQEVLDLAKFPSENPHPVMRINRDGTIMYANDAAQSLLQQNDLEIGMAAPQDWCRPILQAFRLDSIETFELTHVARVFSFAVAPVIESGYANWYGRDITEHRQADRDARTAHEKLLVEQRMARERAEAELVRLGDELVRETRLATIGQVSGSIAHELRNPLGSVRNAAYYLRKHGVKNEARTTKLLEIIDGQTTRAERIIANLLEMTRAKEPLTREVDLRDLLEDTLEHLEGFDEIRCTIKADPEPFLFHVDLEHFRLVAANLMTNAAQAMNGNGELYVEASRGDDADIIVFRDNGPGIASEVCDTLFEPLVTTKATGTGLGLSICRQIVELHGGTIEMTDGNKPGAAFRISLPRHQKQEDNNT